MRTLFPLLFSPLFFSACTSAAPPPKEAEPTPSAAPAQETPSAKCLALANATRERKPNEPQKVGVRHILVMHTDSRKARETITRTREEACLRALAARDKILAGEDFDAILADYSDEPGAKDRRGSIGTVERSEVMAPFADAAFELSVGQMSDVVETASGFHLILRNE